MNFSKQSILLFFVFIIYPLGAIPLILIEIYNKKYYAYSYLAVFMGLLAFLWTPSGDLSRIQEDFDFIRSIEFLDLFNIISLDYVYNIILFVFGRLNLDFAHVRFIICIISYLLFFKIIKKIIRDNSYISSSKLNSFLVFLTFFFLLRFTGFLTGVRFTFAFSIFLYGFFNVFYDTSRKGWYFMFAGALVHFSFWILIFVILLQKLFKFKFNRLSIFLFIFLALFFSIYIVSVIISILPIDESLKFHLENYTTGFFALDEYKTKSFLFKVSRFLSYFLIYPAFFFVLIKKKNIYIYSIFILMIIVLSLSFNMNSIYGRYAFISVFLFIIPFFVNYNKANMGFFRVFFICSVITYLASIQTVKRELFAGMQYKILYSPLPLIMMSEYDKKWINNNIEENGSMTKFQK
jgi:hypothetical protein